MEMKDRHVLSVVLAPVGQTSPACRHLLPLPAEQLKGLLLNPDYYPSTGGSGVDMQGESFCFECLVQKSVAKIEVRSKNKGQTLLRAIVALEWDFPCRAGGFHLPGFEIRVFLLLGKLPLRSSEELTTPSQPAILVVVGGNVLYITKGEIEAGYRVRTYFALDSPIWHTVVKLLHMGSILILSVHTPLLTDIPCHVLGPKHVEVKSATSISWLY